MCGRFRVARSKEILEEAFDAEDSLSPGEWQPRYNVAPGQPVVAVVQNSANQYAERTVRRLTQLRWGLVPAWAKDAAVGHKMINARAETAADRPAFCEAMRRRRCLIPADGFYEWKRAGKEKLPYCFTLADDAVFAFAGLWEQWRSPQGQAVESCTILTTSPNEWVRDVHDRMPVILPQEAYDLWLDPGFTRVEEMQPLLRPYAGAMRRYRVSSRVNQVKNDDAECAAEVEAA
jgi:putative SOS response-associated peptidase YedK